MDVIIQPCRLPKISQTNRFPATNRALIHGITFLLTLNIMAVHAAQAMATTLHLLGPMRT
jgi:hypothetical protein